MKKSWKQVAAYLFTGVLLLSVSACGGSVKEEKEVKKEEEKIVFEYTNKEAISLWEKEEDMPYYDASVTGQSVTLTPYVLEGTTDAGCVIICPGGGYQHLATEKEGTAPALAFNENGIAAFVLEYRVKPYTYKAILSDVFRAIRFVRYHAEEFGIDPDKIAIMGSSAGGHLATMSLEHYDEDEQNLDAIDKVSAKPDYGILCYPVMSLQQPYAHKGSRDNFLGDEASNEEMLKKYSGDLGVTKDTPPCFIWHCEPDRSVPYQNSQLFVDAMNAAGVECEFHLYKIGAHGLGLASEVKEVNAWFGNCVTWLKKQGY